MNIAATQTHCGQYKRYGDFFRVWDITTGEPARKDESDRAEVLDYCFDKLIKRRIPESSEYHSNIRYGGSESGNANYYFAGYYTLIRTDIGFKFTVCEPYCD